MFGRIGLAVGALSMLLPAVASHAGPARDAHPSSRLTLGGAFTIEADGCERRSRHFQVSSRRPIDVSKIEKGQIVSGVYLKPRDHAGRAGWRNVSVSSDGRVVDFELFAEGAGHMQTVASEGKRCVEAGPARLVVDVDAWVLDP